MGLTIFVIFLQILWCIIMLLRVSAYAPWINALFSVIGLVFVIYIINRDTNPSYKIAWLIPIFIFPIFGVLIYLLFGNKKYAKVLRKKFKNTDEIITENLKQDEKVLSEMEERDATCARYLKKCGYPVYDNTETTYFPSGESMWPQIISEISKAEHFIFLEYFIIGEGKVWNSILDILVKKAKEGVDVRVIYDDVGCLSKIPTGYTKKLNSMGIKALAFNPFIPFISAVMNNRDHRKILVVDGHTAFTGGINLADEYMNIIYPYGYWKDTGIMLHGKAVWNLTYMFLQMWNVIHSTKEDFEIYHPEKHHMEEFSGTGFTQPFSDSPLDDESISQNVYIDIISRATKYVYISTPYLVIDDEMKNALTFAAKRGVDVRIITPGIPDKKIVYRLTRSNYPPLLAAGVKIYEFEEGFVHAKSIVSDDRIAVVGTINLDFRSLYLHFECGVLMVETPSVAEVRNDNLETFKKSREITTENRKRNIFERMFDTILRTLAPLL